MLGNLRFSWVANHAANEFGWDFTFAVLQEHQHLQP